ncbi:MAG TPA: alpha/beta hydrolase [Caulobacteraceae bacterium]
MGLADPVIQRQLLKAVLSLPRPVLRVAAGGKAVHVGDRALDPRFQFLIHAAKRFAATEGLSEEQVQKTRSQQFSICAGAREPGVTLEDLSIPHGGGGIAARLYRASDQHQDMALLVYVHGLEANETEGFESCDAFCSILARCGHAPVLAITCRPNPERPFRGCLEVVMAAYRYGLDNAVRFGAPDRVAAIAGDSIGGAFAALLCQALKRLGEAQPALQLLVYPWLDLSAGSTTKDIYDEATLPAQDVEAWAAGFLGPEDNPSDPCVSPAKAEDLSGLAPAIVVTAGFDPLVDQGREYAEKLKAAGDPIVHRCYSQLVHGFAAFTGVVPAADIACREIAGLVREGLQGRIPAPGSAAD